MKEMNSYAFNMWKTLHIFTVFIMMLVTILEKKSMSVTSVVEPFFYEVLSEPIEPKSGYANDRSLL